MPFYTYQYRIKDSKSKEALLKLSKGTNFIWNYINSVNNRAGKKYQQCEKTSGFLTDFDFNNLTAGSSKLLKIHSDTINEISKAFVTARTSAPKGKKFRLKFRSFKRNLGWIPFKRKSIQIHNNKITFLKQDYRFWKSRSLPADAVIKNGSFNENSKGNWFINITFESKSLDSKNQHHQNPSEVIGIDLGIKALMTLSNGNSEFIKNYSKLYKNKLAMAQRAKKKRLVKSINLKIQNSRKDDLHKLTTKIAKTYGNIAIGNVSTKKIVKLKNGKTMNSSIYNAGWYMIKSFLKYKAIKLGGFYQEVNEAYSTQTCNVCGTRSGPKGKLGLKTRSWTCISCHASHDRDVNAAQNIAKKFLEDKDLAIIANDNIYPIIRISLLERLIPIRI